MPFHHHQNPTNHHHHAQPQISINQCSSCCCCPSPPPPPPPPSTTDQLLQLLLLQSQPSPLPQPYLNSRRYHHQPHRPIPHSKYPDQTQPLLQSLIRRVAALESSLSNLSPPPPPSPSPASPPQSLKHLAAKTIQSHFRRFLVRRSETLRHLKRLAAIKSHAAALKSSLSGKAPVDPDALSQKAMDLLLQLDSIQSGDPMIREGRRSISRELVRILEFVDKVFVKECDGRASVDDENGIPCAKPKRRVSFAANGKGTRVSASSPEAVQQSLIREAEENEGFSRVYDYGEDEEHDRHLRSQEFYQFSDGEESPRVSAGGFMGGNGVFGLHAPMPVKMEEPRRTQRLFQCRGI